MNAYREAVERRVGKESGQKWPACTQTVTDLDDLTAIDVCVDCYFAHHYGFHSLAMGGFLIGPDFEPGKDWTAREPLALVAGLELSDWTYDESGPENAEQIERYGSGHTTFSHSACHGCGSTLSGSRERLAIHPARHAPDCKCSNCYIPRV